MDVAIGLGQPQMIEFARLRAGLREKTDVGADFEKASRHAAVAAQDVEIPHLRSLARAERDIGHVLGLSLVQRVQLIIAVVLRAIACSAALASRISEEDATLIIAGQKLAVLIERQILGTRA